MTFSSQPADAIATAQDWISMLSLEAHVEGGYFRRILQTDHRPLIETDQGPRFALTSIYYLLDANSPIGHFHRNRSDIMHVFVDGDPITYYLLNHQNHLETVTLGRDIRNGETPTLFVPGGAWKASRLEKPDSRGFGLITEVVSPGFDYRDMALANREELIAEFPEHQSLIHQLTR